MRNIPVFLIAILFLSAWAPMMSAAESAPPEYRTDIAPPFEWPMYGGGPSRQGIGQSAGPVNATERWATFIKTIGYGNSLGATVAGGRVFMGLERQIMAFDEGNGTQLWTFQLTRGGTNLAPLVHDGLVLFGTLGDNGTFYALEESSGNIAWTAAVGDITSICPVASGDVVYVPTDTNGIFALDILDGSVSWHLVEGTSKKSSPALAGGILYCAGEGEIFALDTNRQRVEWRNFQEVPRPSSVVYADGRLLVHTLWSLECFNATSGKRLWKQAIDEAPYDWHGTHSTPAVAQGQVYLGTENPNKLCCYDLRDGTRLWSEKMPSSICSAPAISENGMIFVQTGSSLEALDARSRMNAWSYPARDWEFSPALAQGCVFFFDGNYLRSFGEPVPDNEDPVLRITSPTDGTVTATRVAHVTAQATDDRGIYSVKATLDGRNWTVLTGPVTWTGAVRLENGRNRLIVRTTDIAGKLVHQTVNVTLDTEPPHIAISTPSTGEMFCNATVTIDGTASDNLRLGAVEVSLNQKAWKAVSGTVSWRAIYELPEGSSTIHARATDPAGNTCVTSVEVLVDTKAPGILILSPDQGARLSNIPATITGECSDETGVTKVEICTVEPVWYTCTGNTSWAGSLLLEPGHNHVLVRATDALGNQKLDLLEVEVVPTENPDGRQWAYPLLPSIIILAGALSAAFIVSRARKGRPSPASQGVPPPAAPPDRPAGPVVNPPQQPNAPGIEQGNVQATVPAPATGAVASQIPNPNVLSEEDRKRLENEVESELSLAGLDSGED